MNQGWGIGDKNPNHSSNTTIIERKEKSPRTIEYWLKKTNGNLEEAKELKSKWYKHLFDDIIVSTTSIEYWLKKTNGNLEEAKTLLAQRQATNKPDKYIREYGKELGLQLYKQKLQKWQDKLQEN